VPWPVHFIRGIVNGVPSSLSPRDIACVQDAIGQEPTGVWDLECCAAIANVQRRLGLPPTGAIDPETLDALGVEFPE
jgi:murein L,D-transpeptidase YcbB/YkuD